MTSTGSPEVTPLAIESLVAPQDVESSNMLHRMEFTPGGYWLTIHYDEISAGPFEVVYGSSDEAFGEVVHSFVSKDAGVAVFLLPEHLIGSNYEVEGPIGELPLL